MQKFAYFKDFYNQIGGSMSEEKTQAVEETVSEPTPKETVQTSSNDQFIAESKKYRKRAQDAEAKLKEYQNRFAKVEEEKLKEKEDFKALYEKVSSENEALDATAQKWNKYEENRRNSLLEAAPEKERERLAGLDLDTLEYVTSKINNEKPNMPEVAGRARNNMPQKPYAQMTDAEKKANWNNIVKQFNKI